MRQIEKMMVRAFDACKDFHLSNTDVLLSGSGSYMLVFLHHNLIARKDIETGAVEYSCGGWHTVTTASRLRALGAAVHIKNGRIVNNSDGSELRLSF